VDRRGDLVIAVGERGHILRSTDASATWTQVLTPTRSFLTSVWITESGTIWAAGHDAVLLASTDGGLTWEIRYYAPEEEAPFLAIHFHGDRGFVVGAYGLYLETRDGGVTWERRDIHEEGPHWYGMARDTQGRLYLAGEFGIFLRSEDDGLTWVEAPSPYSGTFFGVLTAGDAVLVHGLRGKVFRSEDGGLSWNAVATGTEAGLLGGLGFPDGSAMLVGLSGAIIYGRGETMRPMGLEDRRGLASAVPLADGRILLVGEHGLYWLDSPEPAP